MNSGDVPTANYIVKNGFDWVWASPCAGDGSGCAEAVTLHDGWRLPTAVEWERLLPSVADFGGKCGSAWFQGRWSHCDFGDSYWFPTNVFNSSLMVSGGPGNTFGETILIRGSSVPEPGTLLLLLGAAGAFGIRRAMR